MKVASASIVFVLGAISVASFSSVACSVTTNNPEPSSSSSGGSSSGGSSSGGSSGTTTRTGETTCGSLKCTANQHCDNLICETGCASDNNCAANQTCVKPSGEDFGTCQNTTTPTTKDCAGYQEKCTTCGETAANCEASCKVITTECVECVKNTSGCTLDSCKSVCGVDE
jgi:hypothetical protein